MSKEVKELFEHMTTSIIFEKDTLEAEGINPEILEAYLDLAKKKSLKKGEYVQEISNNIEGLCFIKKGRLKSSFIGKDGTTKTFSIVGEGCLFGEQFVLHGQPALFETEVIQDAELYFFEKDIMLDIMKNNFEVNLFVVKSLAIKSRMIAVQLEDKCVRNILQNVCRILYSIVCYEENNGNTKGDIIIKLTHQELADIISAHRVTVTKSLSYLKKLGIIDYKYETIIIKEQYKRTLKKIAFE